MENKDIKIECESIYEQIKLLNTRLEDIRKLCKHEHTYEGFYSYRVGSINNATICSYCNKCIKTHS